MNNRAKQSIILPNIKIDEKDLEDITIINPIDFISEEENQKIFKRVKEGLLNINNPERWLSIEDFEKNVKERFNI